MPDLVCEDCGRKWDRITTPGEHALDKESAARVAGWTVWREQGGQQRQTILCPKHRKQRGIPARVVPLEDTA